MLDRDDLLSSSIFVAEVGVPAALYGRRDMRARLDEPDRYGVSRGYWSLWLVPDGHGAESPAGLRLTVEFGAADIGAAEDFALSVGNRVGSAAAFFSGAPSRPTELLRIASVTVDGAILRQWDYYYDERERPGSVRVTSEEVREFLRKLALSSPSVSSSLALGMRWYSASVGALSPLDAYVAAWFGLEAIGALLADLFHPDGPRAPCRVCGNDAGQRRDSGRAAIDHLILRVAPELYEHHSPSDLYELRSQIAHGYRSGGEVEAEVEEFLPDLQMCLHAGVLTARYGPLDEETFGWKAALQRDYEFRPDGRATVWSDEPLADYNPFLGRWLKVDRDLAVERSGLHPETGVYQREARMAVRRGAYLRDEQELMLSYSVFPRMGISFGFADSPQGDVLEEEWRPRPLTPAWERALNRQDAPDTPQ